MASGSKIQPGGRFAAVYTDTKDIRHHVYEIRNYYGQIADALIAEREGDRGITADTLTDGLKQWLECKGFDNDKAIADLGKLGATFTQALHMLMCVLLKKQLPKRSHTASKRVKVPKSSATQSYSREKLEAVEALWKEQEEKMLAAITGEDNEILEDIELSPTLTRLHSTMTKEPNNTENETEAPCVPQTLVRDKRLRAMLLDGFVFVRRPASRPCPNQGLNIGGHYLRWPDFCMPSKFRHKEKLRVWIDYTYYGIHPRAWYKDGVPNLQTFAFLVGMPEDSRSGAEHFDPHQPSSKVREEERSESAQEKDRATKRDVANQIVEQARIIAIQNRTGIML